IIDCVVIEWVDRQRRRPMAAILERLRRRVEGVNPRRNGACALGAIVVTRDFVTVARCPDDVRVSDVGQGESRFTSAESVIPGGGSTAATATATTTAPAAGRIGSGGVAR